MLKTILEKDPYMLLDVPDCCVTLQGKWHEDFDNHGKPIASWIGYKQRRALKKKKQIDRELLRVE